jgi:hypothetical protein
VARCGFREVQRPSGGVLLLSQPDIARAADGADEADGVVIAA